MADSMKLNEARGLGDLLAMFFEGMGIAPCEPCKRRAHKLNKLWSFQSNVVQMSGHGGASGLGGLDNIDITDITDIPGEPGLTCPPGMSFDHTQGRCMPPRCPDNFHWDVEKRTCVPNCPLGYFWNGKYCQEGADGAFALVFENENRPSHFHSSTPGFEQFLRLQQSVRAENNPAKSAAWFAVVDQVSAVNAGKTLGSFFKPTPCEAYVDTMKDVAIKVLGIADCGSPDPKPGDRNPRWWRMSKGTTKLPSIDKNLRLEFFAPNGRSSSPVCVIRGSEPTTSGFWLKTVNVSDAGGIWTVIVSREDNFALPIKARIFSFPRRILRLIGRNFSGSGEFIVVGDGPDFTGTYINILMASDGQGDEKTPEVPTDPEPGVPGVDPSNPPVVPPPPVLPKEEDCDPWDLICRVCLGLGVLLTLLLAAWLVALAYIGLEPSVIETVKIMLGIATGTLNAASITAAIANLVLPAISPISMFAYMERCGNCNLGKVLLAACGVATAAVALLAAGAGAVPPGLAIAIPALIGTIAGGVYLVSSDC